MTPIAKIPPLEAKTRCEPSRFLTGRAKFQKIFAALVVFAILLLPLSVWAVVCTAPNTPPGCTPAAATDFKSLVSGIISGILGPLIPVIISLAVIVFLWGVLKFIIAAGDEKKRKEGRDFIIWGLVGITIMFSIWGLVKILTDTLNLDNTIPTIPKL